MTKKSVMAVDSATMEYSPRHGPYLQNTAIPIVKDSAKKLLGIVNEKSVLKPATLSQAGENTLV